PLDVAGGGVVNSRIPGQIAEVALHHLRGRQSACIRPSQLPLRGALVIDKEEQLIFLDGSAEGAAKLVLVVPVLVREPGGVRLEVVARCKILVEMELVGAAVK